MPQEKKSTIMQGAFVRVALIFTALAAGLAVLTRCTGGFGTDG